MSAQAAPKEKGPKAAVAIIVVFVVACIGFMVAKPILAHLMPHALAHHAHHKKHHLTMRQQNLLMAHEIIVLRDQVAELKAALASRNAQ